MEVNGTWPFWSIPDPIDFVLYVRIQVEEVVKG